MGKTKTKCLTQIISSSKPNLFKIQSWFLQKILTNNQTQPNWAFLFVTCFCNVCVVRNTDVLKSGCFCKMNLELYCSVYHHVQTQHCWEGTLDYFLCALNISRSVPDTFPPCKFKGSEARTFLRLRGSQCIIT